MTEPPFSEQNLTGPLETPVPGGGAFRVTGTVSGVPRTTRHFAFAGCAAVLLLAGCQSNGQSEVASNVPSSPTTDASSSSAPAGPPNFTHDALSISDMPTGWTSTTNAIAMSLGDVGCLKTAASRAGTKQARYETFAGPLGAPVFSQSLAYYEPSAIAATYTAGLAALRACKSVALKAGKTTFTGPLTPTSFPPVGVQSQMFTLTATTKTGGELTEYVLLARTSNVLMETTYATLPKNANIGDFLTLSTKGSAKLS